MKFCMVTTFFGANSFGGDAAYVDRLSRALCRRGHEVHVFHCVDAFNAVKGEHPLREYEPPAGLHLHPLKSPFGLLSPLATQATGLPLFKSKELRAQLDAVDTDIVHFHNISLVGGPGVLRMGENAVRLMTAHEHWINCETHLLWKYGERSCEKPACTSCALRAARPPQLWRRTDLMASGLRELDALIFPSRHALELHRAAEIGAPMIHIPYFLPDDWSGGLEEVEPAPAARPYLAAAGRLVKMKGFHRLIPLMKFLPEIDLIVAGTGPEEANLHALAREIPNVKFAGLLGGRALGKLFHGARAVVVPSLFPETFGYVVLEAFAMRTPVIVNLAGGALGETGVRSGGGLGYREDSELLLAMRRLVHDDPLRERLAARGFAARAGEWSETSHVDRYLNLIGSIREGRPSAAPPRPKMLDAAKRQSDARADIGRRRGS